MRAAWGISRWLMAPVFLATGLFGLAQAGCSGATPPANIVFSVDVPCKKETCDTLEEQADFVDELLNATGGETFALEACNDLLLITDAAGTRSWAQIDFTTVVAVETPGKHGVCVARGGEFCSPQDCNPPTYAAKDPSACAALKLTGDPSCDACIGKNCCNVASYCSETGPVCAAFLACQRSGGIDCAGPGVVDNMISQSDDQVGEQLFEELGSCDESCDIPGCFNQWLNGKQ